MGRKGRQFLLLLWKNFLIQKRKVVTTIFQIAVPTFFALILIFIRLRVTGEMKDNKIWPDCDSWDKLDWKLGTKKLVYSPRNNATHAIMEHLKAAKFGITGKLLHDGQTTFQVRKCPEYCWLFRSAKTSSYGWC